MKVLRYKIQTGVTEEGDTIVCEVSMGWNAENEASARAEALGGEYVIEEDGEPDLQDREAITWGDAREAYAKGVGEA